MRLFATLRFSVFAAAALIIASNASPAAAGPAFDLDQVRKFLVIGTGQGTTGSNFAAFQMSNVELGADQEIV